MPFEVTSGMEFVALKKKCGKDLIMSGNIDKRAFVKGKEALTAFFQPLVSRLGDAACSIISRAFRASSVNCLTVSLVNL